MVKKAINLLVLLLIPSIVYAVVYADRVQETTSTVGTGTYYLNGAVTGFQTFVAGIGDGNQCYYTVVDSNGNWEIGLGTVTDGSPDTLSRDSILASSNGGLAVDWAAGSKTIFNTLPASAISDFEQDTHASEHAVGGADSVFPADPNADKYLKWDDATGTLVWADAGTASALNDLTDVTITTPTDGQLLKYNATSGIWENWTATYLTSESDPIWLSDKTAYYTKIDLQTSGSAQVHWDNLTNTPVNLDIDSTDDLLSANLDTETELEGQLTDVTNVYTNNDGALADDDLTNNVVSDLSDVTITTPTDGQLLKYNATSGIWENWTANYLTSESDPVFSAVDTEAELEAHLTDATNIYTNNDGLLTADDLSDNTTDDLAEGTTNLYCTLTNIQSATSNDFHNIGGVDDDVPDDDSEVPDVLSVTSMPNLTTNGFVKTSGGTGTLTIDTNSYLPTIGGGTIEPKLTISDSTSTAPLNITEKSTPPSTPSAGDVYLDDGTNTASGNPGWRRYDGTAWEDISAASGGLVAHASTHITGGSDEIDGDKLDIDYTPTNYTPDTTPTEVDNADNLTAHLAGIDTELGNLLTSAASTYYVDVTTGSDTNDGLTSATAFQTIQRACDVLEGKSIDSDVTINIAAGTYSEAVIIPPLLITGDYHVTFQGAYTTVETGTASSAIQYSTGTFATLTDTTKAWTTDAHAHRWLHITGGTGYRTEDDLNWFIIKSNTADTLSIIGVWNTVPDSTTTYEIVERPSLAGVNIDGGSGTREYCMIIKSERVNIRHIYFSGANFELVQSASGADLCKLVACEFDDYNSARTGSANCRFVSGVRLIACWSLRDGTTLAPNITWYAANAALAETDEKFATSLEETWSNDTGNRGNWLSGGVPGFKLQNIHARFIGNYIQNINYQNASNASIMVERQSLGVFYANYIDTPADLSVIGLWIKDESNVRMHSGNIINGATSNGIEVLSSTLEIRNSGGFGDRQITNCSGYGIYLDSNATLYTNGNTIIYSGNTDDDVGMMETVACRVYGTVSQSIPDITATYLEFNAERRDTFNLHNTTTNSTRITIPYDGWYQISGMAQFATSSTGRRQIFIDVNRTTRIAVQQYPAYSTGGLPMTISTLYYLNAGDYIELGVYQDSGAALDVLASSAFSPEFAIVLISDAAAPQD